VNGICTRLYQTFLGFSHFPHRFSTWRFPENLSQGAHNTPGTAPTKTPQDTDSVQSVVQIPIIGACVLLFALSANAQQDSRVAFVRGPTWVTFQVIGMTEPPRTDIRPMVSQIWTIPKDQILRAFSSVETGRSYICSEFEDKRMLVYVAPDTYWKIVNCLN